MKNDSLDQDPSFFIRLFFSLSETKRKILITLFKYDQPNGECFPSIRKIAKGARCSERFVKKFFKENEGLGKLLFERQHEFCPKTGRQTSNTYYINKTLKHSLSWLDVWGYLRSSKNKLNKIISHWEKDNFVHPPRQRFVHPLNKDLKEGSEEYRREGEYVNPLIQNVGWMSLEQKIILSKYPEKAIVEAIDDAVWYQKVKGKVRDPYDFLTNRLQHRAGLRR